MHKEKDGEVLTILQAPANSSGFMYNNEKFVPDEHGQIHVPASLVPIAFSHGFSAAQIKHLIHKVPTVTLPSTETSTPIVTLPEEPQQGSESGLFETQSSGDGSVETSGDGSAA